MTFHGLDLVPVSPFLRDPPPVPFCLGLQSLRGSRISLSETRQNDRRKDGKRSVKGNEIEGELFQSKKVLDFVKMPT